MPVCTLRPWSPIEVIGNTNYLLTEVKGNERVWMALAEMGQIAWSAWKCAFFTQELIKFLLNSLLQWDSIINELLYIYTFVGNEFEDWNMTGSP